MSNDVKEQNEKKNRKYDDEYLMENNIKTIQYINE